VPSHESQLALANIGALGDGRLLALGFDAPLPVAVQLTQDARRARAVFGARLAAWPEEPEPFDGAVVEMPKARDRLDMNLAAVASQLRPGARVVLVGHNDAGARSAGPHLERIATGVEVLDYRFHCRAFAGTVASPPAFDPAAWRKTWTEDVAGAALTLCSYPGVFAHGRVDPATRMLLEALRGARVERALDVGCGDGVIGAWLAASGADAVECADADALAVRAAAETLAPYANARAYASDVYSDAARGYSHIVSNAPFHAGVRTTSEVAQRIIREAPDHLEARGELWLVANRFLDYMPVLNDAFAGVAVVADDAKYRVFRARKK
jgi:16S rRNA (guanine1207-N2)-methyltransferase